VQFAQQGDGILLGAVLPSARSAQAVGLPLFFPSFLLGAGGPPPHVMGSVPRSIAEPLPLTLVTKSVRDPMLGIGAPTSQLLTLFALEWGIADTDPGWAAWVGGCTLTVVGGVVVRASTT